MESRIVLASSLSGRTICSYAEEAVAFAGILGSVGNVVRRPYLMSRNEEVAGNFMAAHRGRPGGDDSVSATSDSRVHGWK